MRKLLIPLCFSLLFACEHDVPLSELNLDIEAKVILMGGIGEGYLNCDIFYSKSIADKGDLRPIGNAELFLLKNRIPVENIKIEIDTGYSYKERPGLIDTIIYDKTISYFSYYIKSLEITLNCNYLLKVYVPGHDTLFANTYLPGKVKAELIDFQYLFEDQNIRKYKAIFKTDDNALENNYYSFTLSGKNSGWNQIGYQYLNSNNEYTNNYSFSDRMLENNTFIIEILEPKVGGRVEYATWNICQIDSNSFLYGKSHSLQSAMNQTNEFFAFEPINIYNNISNGYGYFGAVGPNYSDTLKLLELYPDPK